MSDRKVNYFEPNDFDFNVEDLCVGVKLEVAVPGRAISAGNGTISWQTIVDEANLFGGTNGYLSTSYSDISSLDAHNGGNKDSFGIEYINIHYNSWNFPEVDMKLIDVRGNAIMNPLESRRDDKNKTGSFLNALFTFPYPMFKLTVKGYYGRPVTYKLTVRDVRTNFNASNGNFEVTVKFIGYMFGYLNDIPMQYLLIAPHISYDGKTHSLGKFSDDDKHDIPNFMDFLEGVTTAIEAISKNEEIGNLKQRARRIESMTKVMSDIDFVIERINGDLKEQNFRGVFTITKDENDKTKYSLGKLETDENGNTITTGMQRTTIDKLKEDMNKIINTHEHYMEEFEQAEEYRIKAITDDFKPDNNAFLSNDEVSLPFEIYFDYENLKKGVKGKLQDLDHDKNDTDEQMVGEMGSAYTQTIGWDPTIGNIFEMVLAHFKCFYENYYTCIKNIQGTSSLRRLSDLSVTTDCRTIGGANLTVPPYPLLTNDNKKYEWIGNVAGMGESYEENAFVEAIVNAATSTGEELASIAMEYDLQKNFMNFPQKGIPTLLSDIYNYKSDKRTNPYAGTSYAVGSDGGIPTAMKVFAKRLLLRYVYNGGESAELPLKNFAKLEALNCYREHLKEDEIGYLEQEDCWGEIDFIDKIKTYIKNIFTNCNGSCSYETLSIYYPDYANVDVNSAATTTTITKSNSTFDEDDVEVADYGNIMDEVYEYLNAQQGALTGSYQKVFPLNIPAKLNEANEASKGLKYLEGKYKVNANKLMNIDHQMPGGEGYYVDCFTFYNYWEHKSSSIYEPPYMLSSAEDALLYGFCESIGYGEYCSDRNNTHQTNEISVIIDEYSVAKIPTLLLVFVYLLSQNESVVLRKIDLGESVKKVITEEYLSNKKSEIINKLKKICQQGEHTELRKEVKTYSTDYYRGIEFNNDSQKIFDEILSETVTLYTLHGVYRGYSGSEDTMLNSAVGNDARIFVTTLKELYGTMNETKYRIEQQKSNYASMDKKIAIYMTMKELYDRWKFGTWRPNGSGTQNGGQDLMVGLKNFVFLDSQYDNIKYKHFVNFDSFADLIRKIVDNAKEMSVYSFLYEVCKAANMTLHALPINVYDYLGGDTNKIREMFNTYPYMACEDNAMQTTYIAMYSHKPSEHLNIVDSYSSYEDDGLDFTSNETVINSDKPLPVFGVTYGLQKQRFFKNISVGSDNPKTTAHSLMSELLISKQATSGSQSLGFEAHDIFDVYASKSYTCRVEMMGNAMIMPMMYFQLNNIPMFKGGYFITNAEHSITRNGMTTTFTGVRVNKNRFDLLPKNIPDAQTYSEHGRSGAYGTGENVSGKASISAIMKTMAKNNTKFKDYKNTVIILDAGHDMVTSGKESPKFDVYKINHAIADYTCEKSDDVLYIYKEGRKTFKLFQKSIANDIVWRVYFDHSEFSNENGHPESGNILAISYKYDATIPKKYISVVKPLSLGAGKMDKFIYKDRKYYYVNEHDIDTETDNEEVIGYFDWAEEHYGDILGKKTITELYNEYFAGINKPVPQTGDTTEDGSLRPLSIERKEEYQATGGTNNQGITRYREYWGNRKIVAEIKRQLIAREVPAENIRLFPHQERTAGDFSDYSAKVNKIYEETDGKCIMVSIHSNADKDREQLLEDYQDTSTNYWSIYCQNNNEYIRSRRGVRKNFKDGGLKHEEDSWYLSSCILRNMKKMVNSSEFKQNFPSNLIQHTFQEDVLVFEKTDEGIRPLTFCKAPAVLSENFFHTSPDGIRILGSKKGVELIAKAHVDGIMEFLTPLETGEGVSYVDSASYQPSNAYPGVYPPVF
jgi:N-acetylmuramoyl-L-alanine amidase